MPHILAGTKAPSSALVDLPALISAYYSEKPDPNDPSQRVAFGTSGHRGSSFRLSFNEAHILAVATAITEYRKTHDIDGPLFLGKDTHALSEPALRSVLEVLAAHDVDVRFADAPTATPLVSHAILTHNRGRSAHLADGIIITPSHNPPDDGGIKYNPPHGGPADGSVTSIIEKRANEILAQKLDIKRISYAAARKAERVRTFDFVTPYVADLPKVIDIERIQNAKLSLGADPMGGTAGIILERIADRFGIDIDITNPDPDPRFASVPFDHDGKIRMDCSSPFAMSNLLALRSHYDLAFGNDADADRHGIVTRSSGLLNPNHYLAVAIHYLFQNRSGFAKDAVVGKTLVSSSLIDRVAHALGRRLHEVPVGFKWFVDGLANGTCGFGGEESAGASFLRKDGTVWTTDKDGIILDLLAAEILASTGRDPGDHYRNLTEQFGEPTYARIDAPATPKQKAALSKLSPEQVTATTLAGEPILEKLTKAPGNGAALGGMKVTTKNGWFAARPSGTEDVYKIYAESFLGPKHLETIQNEAQEIVSRTVA